MRVDPTDKISNRSEQIHQAADMHLHVVPLADRNDSSDMQKSDNFGCSLALPIGEHQIQFSPVIIMTDPHLAKNGSDRLSHLAYSDPHRI